MIQVFHKLAEIGQNGNICHDSLYENLSYLDLTRCSLSHLGMCHLRDLRSVYGHTLLVQPNDKVQDCCGPVTNKKLRVSQIKHASMAQRAEFQIQISQIQSSMLTVLIFCCCIFFCFHVVKHVMPILPILCVCEKLDWTI